MTRDTLPTYAIVELLMRLEQVNPHIGSYKDHAIYATGVLVKTTGGSIMFSKPLIMQQFEAPELITEAALKDVALTFKPANTRQ